MRVIEILATILEPDSYRAFLFFANEGRVDMSATDIGEAADMADHFAEKVGTFPGDGEGTDPPRACPADQPLFRVLGEVVVLCDFWEKLGL